MPEKDRSSAIPRPLALKRTNPFSSKLKRNVPIPLRGTLPSSTSDDTYTQIPPRPRIPSANVPVMHSPALRDNSSRLSSPSIYSQSSNSVSSTKVEKDAVAKKNMANTQEIEDEADAYSELDVTNLTPGASGTTSYLEAKSGTKIKHHSSAGAGESGSDSGKTVVEPEVRWMSSPNPNLSSSLTSSPREDRSGLNDSTKTPRASLSQAVGAYEGLDAIPGMRKARTNTMRSMSTVETWRTAPSTATLTPNTITPQVSIPIPHAVLRELRTLLSPRLVAEEIDIPHILCAHDACPSPALPPSGTSSVFGVPICTAARYASCKTVLGGQTHRLPIVVFAAVEELYRIGLSSPRLLRPASTSKSNVTTLPSLVATFDTGPDYGEGLDLSRTRTPTPLDDVSALLFTYLDCLPGPVLVRSLLPALLRLCVRASAPNIRAAQLLLRLLPAPHFSLLVYLLAFLAQIPLYRTVNGWSVNDVAGAFARTICGARDHEGDGEEALEWLLRNWDALSSGLFPGAVFQPPQEANDHTARIAALERQHAAAVRDAYEAGAAAERKVWAGEVQALRESWEREGKVINGIVRRFAEGARP